MVERAKARKGGQLWPKEAAVREVRALGYVRPTDQYPGLRRVEVDDEEDWDLHVEPARKAEQAKNRGDYDQQAKGQEQRTEDRQAELQVKPTVKAESAQPMSSPVREKQPPSPLVSDGSPSPRLTTVVLRKDGNKRKRSLRSPPALHQFFPLPPDSFLFFEGK